MSLCGARFTPGLGSCYFDRSAAEGESSLRNHELFNPETGVVRHELRQPLPPPLHQVHKQATSDYLAYEAAIGIYTTIKCKVG